MPPTREYPWYDIVSGPDLAQGDIITNCPVLSPLAPDDLADLETPESGVRADVFTHDMVVITQSCDLESQKIDSVVLCPVWTLAEMERVDPKFSRPVEREKIRKGEYFAYHMLNEFAALGRPVSVVDFHRLYTSPKPLLAAISENRGDRARLLPPYREHLAQAFARYFMRVGLPVGVPRFQ